MDKWPAIAFAAATGPALAYAADLPAPVTFDAGAAGTYELSGGADGFAYGLTGTGNGANKGLQGLTPALGSSS